MSCAAQTVPASSVSHPNRTQLRFNDLSHTSLGTVLMFESSCLGLVCGSVTFSKKIKVFFSLKQKKKSQGDTFLSKAGTAWGGTRGKSEAGALEPTRALLSQTSRGMERLGLGGKNERKLFQESRLSLSPLSPLKVKNILKKLLCKKKKKVLISLWSGG